jgi:membrane fusion protein, multidrug efflux system
MEAQMQRRALFLGGAGALTRVALLALRLFLEPTSVSAEPVPEPIPVVTAKVGVSDVPIVKVGLGTVSAYNTVDVRAQVTGTIETIGFVEGQSVHPGSLIAQLDPRQFQAALQQAQAALEHDQANLENAEANLNRFVPLLQRGFSTQQQVGDQTATVAELRASIDSDKAAIFNAQTQLSYTTITSPIDGVTGIRHVDVGNIVQPGQTVPIVTISQLQPISVIFTLPQRDLPDVQEAMRRGPLQTIAYPQDGTEMLDKGQLLLVDNQIDPASGTVRLKATFPNKESRLWPGEFVSVRLVTSVRPNAITVPLSALQQGDAGERVFVVGSDGTVRLQPVTVRQMLDGRALIDDGLNAGDTVVAAGQYRLQNNAPVVSVPPDSPAVANQTAASQGMLQ